MPWQISGRYAETCNCDFVCPCVLTLFQQSTHGNCTFAMGYSVERGSFDDTDMAGVKFVIVGHTPGNMSEGNWQVGLIVDSAATDQQRDAVTAIASGQAGGPMAALSGLISEFKGVESRQVRIEGNGNKWSVSVPDMVEQGVEGQAGATGGILHLDNAGHPAGERIALGHSTGTRINAFGITYEEASGRNNGHFAPFDWSS